MLGKEALKWMEVATESVLLGLESSAVIGLRLHGASTGGPKAAGEAWRMYSEKVIALAELQSLLVSGSLGTTPSAAAKKTLKHYRRKVAANRRRLGKSARL